MNTLDLLADALATCQSLLVEDLAPDRERRDWPFHGDAVKEVQRVFRADVLSRLAEALVDASLLEHEKVVLVRRVVAVGGVVVAILFASGDRAGAEFLLSDLKRLPFVDETELDAGLEDLDNYTLLWLGRWQVTSDADAAKATFKLAEQRSRHPALIQAAKRAYHRASPMKVAPPLITYNGIGTSLYGRRDPDGDSYTATLCFCLIFIPVLPLRAYRVTELRPNSYNFWWREPLSPFATWYRRIVLTAAALAVVAMAGVSYRDSTSVRARSATERAEAFVASGDREAAIDTYEQVLFDAAPVASPAEIGPIGERLATLYLRRISEPFDATEVDRAVAVLGQFESLPPNAWSPEACATLVDAALRWVDALGADTTLALRSSNRLLMALRWVTVKAQRQRLDARRTELVLKIGASLRADWPLEALEVYATDPHGASDATAELAKALRGKCALLDAARPMLGPWLEVAVYSELADAVTAEVREWDRTLADPARASALGGGASAPLAAWVDAYPCDQTAQEALAKLEGAQDPRAGIRRLQRLGKPGWLLPSTRRALIGLLFEAGEQDKAESLIDEMIAARLPGFRQAGETLRSVSVRRAAMLIGQLESGTYPASLDDELRGQSEERQREIVDGWIMTSVEHDSEVRARRAEVERHQEALQAALELGAHRAERARVARGRERASLLNSALKTFQNLEFAADDYPEVHVGLGEVLYQLGRKKEAEVAWSRAEELDDPAVQLQLARLYQRLGLSERARVIATRLYETGPQSQDAALVLARLSDDLDEQERWYAVADQSLFEVRAGLHRATVRNLARKGRWAEASDALIGFGAKGAQAGEADPVEAELEATLLEMLRFEVSGDVQPLARARDHAEEARVAGPRRPEAQLVAVVASENLAMAELLAGWLELGLLKVDLHHLDRVYGAVVSGELRGSARAAARKSGAFARVIELTEAELLSRPQSADAYLNLARLYLLRDDRAALRALRDKARAQPRFEPSLQSVEADRTTDAAALSELELSISLAAQATTRAADSPPTLAAAELWMGLATLDHASLSGEEGEFERAVAALRRAEAAWPRIGARLPLAGALTRLALARAASRHSTLATMLSAYRREGRWDLLLHRALSLGGEVVGELRASPELVEVRTLVAAVREPSVAAWVFGQLFEEPKLGSRAFTSEAARLDAEIRALVEPDDEGARQRDALFRAHP